MESTLNSHMHSLYARSIVDYFFRWIRSNYWMRLSRIWRILQVVEGVMQNTSYPTLPHSIIALVFIACENSRPSSLPARMAFRVKETPLEPEAKKDSCFRRLYYSFKTFSSLKPVNLLAAISLYIGFLGQWFNNLQHAALLTSSVEHDKILYSPISHRPLTNPLTTATYWRHPTSLRTATGTPKGSHNRPSGPTGCTLPWRHFSGLELYWPPSWIWGRGPANSESILLLPTPWRGKYLDSIARLQPTPRYEIGLYWTTLKI